MRIFVKGLTEKPENVNNLEITTLNGTALLAWNPAQNVDVQQNGSVLFRYHALISGAIWENAVKLTVTSGQSTSVALPLSTGTYLAKFADSAGNQSVNAALVVVEQIANVIDMKIVAGTNQHPDFLGVKTNMVVVSDNLQFDVNGGDLFQFGSYEFDNYVDIFAVRICRITIGILSTATNLDNFFDNPVDFFDNLEIFDNPPANVAIETFISTTDDDPSDSPVWSPWVNFTIADYTARAFKFKLEASSENFNHQIQISALFARIELPDRSETDRGITSGTTTKQIDYLNGFFSTPVVNITPVDMMAGDYFTIPIENELRFFINFYNSADVAISRVFNYNSTGY